MKVSDGRGDRLRERDHAPSHTESLDVKLFVVFLDAQASGLLYKSLSLLKKPHHNSLLSHETFKSTLYMALLYAEYYEGT